MNDIGTCSGLVGNVSSTTLGYSGTASTTGGWVDIKNTLTGTNINSTVLGNVGGCTNPSAILTITNSKNMTPRQVNVVVFTITRDEDTNEINSTKFVKQLWVEQKNGTSIDLIVAKQLDKDFDPEFTIIKVLTTVSF